MTQIPLSRARNGTFAVFFANGFGIGAWASAIPVLKRSLALSNSQLSFALLAFAVGAFAALPMSGRLVHRLGGTGRSTQFSAYGFGIALLLPAVTYGLPTLMAVAILLGATGAVMDVAMNAHASVVERGWAKAIMSSFHAAFSVGGLVGTGVGGVLLHYTERRGWLLLPAAIIALGVGVIARHTLGAGEYEVDSPPTIRVPERRLLRLAAIALFCLLVEGAMMDWGGLYLTSVGASIAGAPTAYGVFSLTMIVGRLLGDRVVRKLGRGTIMVGGAGVATAGLVLAVTLPQVGMVLVGFALVGIGLSNIVPAVFSASARAGRTAASGIAMTATAGYAGLVIGPPLIGAVSAALDLRAGMAVLAIAAVAAALTALTT